jgi:hypothetical protein
MAILSLHIDALPVGFAARVRLADGRAWDVELFPDTLEQAVEIMIRFVHEVR